MDLKNNNLKFKYQFLDQISLFEFKVRISYSNQNFEIQIMFLKIELTIFRVLSFKFQILIIFLKIKIVVFIIEISNFIFE